MQEKRVTFETSQLLKESGFDWYDRNYVYDSKGHPQSAFMKYGKGQYKGAQIQLATEYYPRPSLDLVQKWLREKNHIHLIVEFDYEESRFNGYTLDMKSLDCFGKSENKDFEQAREGIIQQTLKHLING
jgi:hypothetical protein